jgi:hypothetical protein
MAAILRQRPAAFKRSCGQGSPGRPHPIKLGQRVEVAIAPPPPRRLMG